MAETVEILIPGPPSQSDPAGMRWLADDDRKRSHSPQWVPGTVVAENPDGTLDVQVGNPRKGGRVLTAAEGTAVGEFRRIAGIRQGDLRAMRQALAPLLQDADPAVRTAAETLAALFGRGGRRNVAQTLIGVANNAGQKSAQRVQALTLLGVLLAQEIDR